MKKFLICFVILLILSFSGCKNEDHNITENPRYVYLISGGEVVANYIVYDIEIISVQSNYLKFTCITGEEVTYHGDFLVTDIPYSVLNGKLIYNGG